MQRTRLYDDSRCVECSRTIKKGRFSQPQCNDSPSAAVRLKGFSFSRN